MPVCIFPRSSTHSRTQAGLLALTPKLDPDGDTSLSPLFSQAKLEVIKRKFTRKSRRVAEAERKNKKKPWHGNGMFTGHKFRAPWEESQAQEGPRVAG